MSSTGEYLDKGIALIKSASELDNSKEYEGALAKYEAGLQYFLLALKNEKNEKSRETIGSKIENYMARAETLKRFLDSEKEKKTQKQLVAASAGNSSNSSAGDDEEEEEEDEEDPEKKRMRNALEGSIVSEKPNVHWDDVAGLESAKEALNEAVIMPIKFPLMFSGKRRPWRGILLYGPPGTGKTYLAKAVATESNCTFFSVSSSDLVSKWQGESEKMVRQLFEMAREQGPSIIFIDEIDALASARSDNDNDSSRRIKNEFLVQMDGVQAKSGKSVLVLGATNLPWQLDTAMRRRFERRVYIPLPGLDARQRIFRIHLGDTYNELDEEDFAELAAESEGYSGSDIANCVRDGLMQPIRTIQVSTHFKRVVTRRSENEEEREYLTPCSPGDEEGEEMSWMSIDGEVLLEPPVTMDDLLTAVRKTKSSVGKDELRQFEDWTEEFGTGE